MGILTLSEATTYATKRKAVTSQVKNVLIDRLALDREAEDLPNDCLMFGVGLGLDSVDALEIAVAVEMEFGVRVDDDNIREMRSINAIVDFVFKEEAANV